MARINIYIYVPNDFPTFFLLLPILFLELSPFGKLLSSAQQQVDEPQKKYGYTETSRFTDVRFGIFTTIKLEGSTE